MKVFLLAALISVASAMVSYKGHEIWSLNLNEKNDRHHLNSLEKHFNLDILGERRGNADVRISPEIKTEMEKYLKMLKISYTVNVQDLEVLLEKERESLNVEGRAFSLTEFNTWEDIVTQLNEVADNNPDATLVNIGNTYEGRPMLQMVFSKGAGRPALWIECGMHAREWITVSTCMWGINKFDQEYGIDLDVTAILDAYDVYILPVGNPDGYSFTWTGDRLWRKNRNNNNITCIGTDLNRNFDEHWCGDGASNDGCSETYCGTSAASEIETQNVQNRMIELRNASNLNILYSIHAYGQDWMWPYAWIVANCPDHAELTRVSDIGVAALTGVYGTPFESGTIATIAYPAAGIIVDYAYEKVGITYSYTLYLRPQTEGEGGFEINASEIEPVAVETWTGLFAATLAV